MKYLKIILSFLLLISGASLYADSKPSSLGVWVTVFTLEDVFASKNNVDSLIKTCRNTGIDSLYLQVYRAGKAYYDTRSSDRSSFDKMFSRFGSDPLSYIISQAKKNNIKVYAWVNTLSIARNKKAHIVKKIGVSALTLDQYERTSLIEQDTIPANDPTKIFLREDQLFLEPGNKEVQDYIVKTISEIMRMYPSLDGVHLDYIRYPGAVPFTPGSRFDDHGISYGYTYRNMKNFKEATGLDIKKMEYSLKSCQKWDDWRRNNVTVLVKKISNAVKKISPSAKISCAVIPSAERAYTVNFQDWTGWLESSLIDYVVLMNYTEDSSLLELRTLSSYNGFMKDRVYVGIGAYLLKEKPDAIKEQIKLVEGLSPGGIVLFSYDEVAASKDLQVFLSKR